MLARKTIGGTDIIRRCITLLIVSLLFGCGTATLSLVQANLDQDESNVRAEIKTIRQDPALSDDERAERLYRALELASSWSLPLTKQLVEIDGVPVNSPADKAFDSRISPPLIAAVNGKNLATARYLLAQGANPHLPLSDYPLTRAVLKQDSQMVALLLSVGANPNAHYPYDMHSKTLLAAALDASDTKTAQLLGDAGG